MDFVHTFVSKPDAFDLCHISKLFVQVDFDFFDFIEVCVKSKLFSI